MTGVDVNKTVSSLDKSVKSIIPVVSGDIDRIDTTVRAVALRFKATEDINIARINAAVIPYIKYLYYSTEYHYLRAMFHASPGGLIGFLISAWEIIEGLWGKITWLFDLLKIQEILRIGKIVYQLIPAFREFVDKLFAKVSEISKKIGFGADGLIHLIHSVQNGVSVLGGLLNKSADWAEMEGLIKAERALSRLAEKADMIEKNPGALLDLLVKEQNLYTLGDTSIWRWNLNNWIQVVERTANAGVEILNSTVDDLQQLRNDLPGFIRDNIPQSIWDGIDWTDAMIDDKIMPGLEKLNQQINSISNILDVHQNRAEELAQQLMRPGDLMLNFDGLTPIGQQEQIDKIDQASSIKYNQDADEITEYDADIIEQFDVIAEALSVPIPPPKYLTMEDMPQFVPEIMPGGERETWFVGDY